MRHGVIDGHEPDTAGRILDELVKSAGQMKVRGDGPQRLGGLLRTCIPISVVARYVYGFQVEVCCYCLGSLQDRSSCHVFI